MARRRAAAPGAGGDVAVLLALLAVLTLPVLAALRPVANPLGADWSARLPGIDGGTLGTGGLGGGDVSALPAVLQAAAAVVLAVLVVLLAGRLVALLRALRAGAAGPAWRGRVAAGGLRRAAGEGLDESAALAEAAAAGAGELDAARRRTGDPWAVSDAVVAAWVRLEDVASGAGAARRGQDTAGEFARALSGRRLVTQAPLEVLLGLYGRARFSDEQLGAADGGEAREALLQLQRELLAAAPAGTR